MAKAALKRNPRSAERGQKRREAALRAGREQREAVRDIGEIPKVVNKRRRSMCKRNFRLFCEVYFPLTFTLAWSPDHLKAIDKIEESILYGGLFGFAMPRGAGKTTLCECAAIWAMLYGHRRFPVIVGSDAGSAEQLLESIKTELQSNELLYDDFPEVCYPIDRLEGIAHRCKGQTCVGKRTGIAWSSDEIIFADVPGTKVGGSIVKVAGITGRIRGLKHKTASGHSIRPDLVIIDDPQTDESANSSTQCASRERTLAGAILGLAGPGKKIAGFMPCTVIRLQDMADSILNRDKHPEWNGERWKLMYKFPTNTEFWDKYKDLRIASFQAGGKGEEATKYYRENREVADAGAEVAWEQRYNEDEESAVQFCMNMLFQDENAFYAEYQNEPKPLESLGSNELTPDEVARKVSRIGQRLVPLEAVRLTSFIDVQGKLLYYVVCAWADDFTGWIIDYGTYPDQHRPYFTAGDARVTLQGEFPSSGQEGQIYAGLGRLVVKLHSQRWIREDGVDLTIERGMIDRGWGESTNTVDKFCRECPVKGVWIASKGWGVRASQRPMSEYRKSPGERVGLNWRIGLGRGTQAKRFVLYDTNFWKSFIAFRLAVSVGDSGCLSLFGEDKARHRMIAEHLTSEYRVRVTAPGGREVDEWQVRPDRTENHWLDCVVGAAVAASERGCKLDESKSIHKLTETGAFVSPPQQQKQHRSWKELQAAARGLT